MDHVQLKTTEPAPFSSPTILTLLVLILSTVALRYELLSIPSLVDSTEGRYAVVAKLMYSRFDFLTPWIDLGNGAEPYLGKPPFHFWLMIWAYTWIGISEFASRLPSYICWGLTAGTVYWFGLRFWNPYVGLFAALTFLSSLLSFSLAGACTLDMTFTLAVSIACAAIGSSLLREVPATNQVSFIIAGVAGGFAVITKGPLGVVVPGVVFFAAWLLSSPRPRISSFDWARAVLYGSLVVVPWYVASEIEHPGFLRYFLVNENLLRFASDNYGDRYGSGHTHFMGVSWIFVLFGFFPWSITFLAFAAKCFPTRTAFREVSRIPEKTRSFIANCDSRLRFTAVWALSVPAFFTPAHQLTPTYLLPALPALSLWLAALFYEVKHRPVYLPETILATIAFLVLAAPIIALVALFFDGPWILLLSMIGIVAIACYRYRKLFLTRTGLLVERLAQMQSVAIVLIYVVIILGFTEHVSLMRSTEVVMQSVRGNVLELDKESTATVAFPFYFPFSAAFYNDIGSLPAVSVAKVDAANVVSVAPDYVIMETKELQMLPTDFGKSYNRLHVIGKWVMYRRRGL